MTFATEEGIGSYFVHTIVTLAFLGPNPDSLEVNHKNGIKTDNRVENLEYCTSSQNNLHAVEMGLRNVRGSNNNTSKLTELDVFEIRARIKAGAEYLAAIARSKGITTSHVCAIRDGKSWGWLKSA